jgi:hypothetical protein
MTWWEAVIYLWLVTAVLVAVYYTGRNMERRDDRSREEAIRAQAYKDGRKSMFDEMVSGSRTMMSREQWEIDHMGVWTTPEKHETKESS